jgi:hypothetical protein
MALIVDLEKIQNLIDAGVRDAKSHLNDPRLACSARYTIDVQPGMVMWRVKETNRGTDPVEIVEAMVEGFASSMSSHIKSTIDEERYIEVARSVSSLIRIKMEQLLLMTREEISAIGGVEVKMEEGGRA